MFGFFFKKKTDADDGEAKASSGNARSMLSPAGVDNRFAARDRDYWHGHLPPQYASHVLSAAPSIRPGELSSDSVGAGSYRGNVSKRPRGEYARARVVSVRDVIGIPDTMTIDMGLRKDPVVALAGPGSAETSDVAQESVAQSDKMWRRVLNGALQMVMRHIPASTLPITEREKQQIARGDAMQCINEYYAESAKIIDQARQEMDGTLKSCRERLAVLRKSSDYGGMMVLNDRQIQMLLPILKIRYLGLKDLEEKDSKVRQTLIVIQTNIHRRRLNARAFPMLQKLAAVQKEMAMTDEQGNKIDVEGRWENVGDDLRDLNDTDHDEDSAMDRLLQGVLAEVTRPSSRSRSVNSASAGMQSMSQQDMLEMLQLIDPSLVMQAPADDLQQAQQVDPLLREYNLGQDVPAASVASSPQVDAPASRSSKNSVAANVRSSTSSASAGSVNSGRGGGGSVSKGYVGAMLSPSEIKRVRERSQQQLAKPAQTARKSAPLVQQQQQQQHKAPVVPEVEVEYEEEELLPNPAAATPSTQNRPMPYNYRRDYVEEDTIDDDDDDDDEDEEEEDGVDGEEDQDGGREFGQPEPELEEDQVGYDRGGGGGKIVARNA